MSNDYKNFDSVQEMVNYLEDHYQIQNILSIRDYGSRAWNLDSETSDMDAGMVYTQKAEEYATIGTYRQNIDRKFMVDGEEFELIGWNIKRFAELLNKSNPSMIEWLNSPIHYYNNTLFTGGARVKTGEDTEDIFGDIKKHANQNFKPIALWGHYRDMGKANYSKYIDNENDLSIKRHLYILRGLTYGKYVLETHRRPSLNFQEFMSEELPEIDIPKHVKDSLQKFVEKKTNGKGSKEVKNQKLWNWMDEEIQRGNEINHSKHDVRGISREKVNNLIKKVVT